VFTYVCIINRIYQSGRFDRSLQVPPAIAYRRVRGGVAARGAQPVHQGLAVAQHLRGAAACVVHCVDQSVDRLIYSIGTHDLRRLAPRAGLGRRRHHAQLLPPAPPNRPAVRRDPSGGGSGSSRPASSCRWRCCGCCCRRRRRHQEQ
jgi:hypothetical protein